MKKPLILLGVCAAWASARTLSLDDVLQSVDRAYPPLLAALAEHDIAGADVLAALGKFDLTFRTRVETERFGFYENDRVVSGFEQATPWLGAEFYGGWRVGDGSFAPYDGKLETRSRGEWSGGLKLPLVRDRGIDTKRAELRKAEIGRVVAGFSIDQQRLFIRLLATRRYWGWVAAAGRVQLAQSMLHLASSRDQFLRESAEAGQIAAIEVAENARAILQRRSILVESERALQQAAIELSLLHRDQSGSPVLVAKDQAPDSFPDIHVIDESKVLAAVEDAIRKRPDLRRQDAQKAQLEIDRRLAMNDRLPGVDLQLGFTAESGQGGVRRGPRELKAAIVFDLPLQRRAATGKLLGANARLLQLAHRERFLRDQIVAEVRDAVSAVRAAHDRARLIGEEMKVAADLEEAERARFQLGDGTLFLVNLREQVTADTAGRHINALNDYFCSLAQYEFSVAASSVPGRRP